MRIILYKIMEEDYPITSMKSGIMQQILAEDYTFLVMYLGMV